MGNIAQAEHTREQLTDLHRGGTHQAGTAAVAHLFYLLNHGVELLALGLVHTVVHVVAYHGAVGGYLHHIELVDVPELTGLGDSGTRHARQLVVHAEVVLKGDGGEGLGGGFHLHVLLGLNGLVQTVAPAAAFHDTARLLVDNLHLIVYHHILVVLVEHGVGLEQLLQSVHTLALYGIVGHQLVFLLQALLIAQTGLGLQFGEQGGDVGQHEELGVVHLLGKPLRALVGQVYRVQLLLHHKVEGGHGLGHAAVVVLHVFFLRLQKTALDAVFREVFDKGFVLGKGFVRAEQRKETFGHHLLVVLLAALVDLLARLGQIVGGQTALHTHQLLHQRLELLEHLVVATLHRTGDDERRTGIVDEHRVDLVDNGVVVRTLYQVVGRDGHVVAKVVETELVVRTEGDVGLIGLAALGRVGTVLVDTVYRQTVEHIEWTHPLGITLGQVVVHRHHVHTVAGQSIQEDGKRGHKGLTLTSGHLGYLALVKHGTAEELHVVVHHVPLQVVAAGHPVVLVDGLVALYAHKVFRGGQLTVEVVGRNHHFLVLGKAAGGLLHNAEGHGKHLVEGALINLENLFLYLVHLIEDALALVDGRLFDGGFQIQYFLFLLLGRILHIALYLFRLGAKGVVVQCLYLGIRGFHFLHNRLDQFHVTTRLVAENGLQYVDKTHISCLCFCFFSF